MVPLNFGDGPAGMGPARRLVAKAPVEPLHIVRRSPDRPFEQIADTLLQDVVCGQADGILDSRAFQELVHPRLSESGVASKGDTFHRSLVARDDRLKHLLPAVRAVNVARAKRTALEIAELIEHEERVIARAAEMAVPTLCSCSPWVGLTLESMSRMTSSVDRHLRTRSTHWPNRSARARRFSGAASHRVSNRPVWLGDAARPFAALPPTIQRIAGS